jgi:ribose 5-phosphate isomerase B
MKVVVGADSAGKPLMDIIAPYLLDKEGVEVTDLSVSEERSGELYADIAERVTLGVVAGEFDRGILICGTGIGVCISANKVPGIRAAVCHDTYSAERARKSNNAQVIAMGARVIGPELAKSIVDTWLASEFDPESPSAPNVAAINALDLKYSKSI